MYHILIGSKLTDYCAPIMMEYFEKNVSFCDADLLIEMCFTIFASVEKNRNGSFVVKFSIVQ
jgi:hypothetical protein